MGLLPFTEKAVLGLVEGEEDEKGEGSVVPRAVDQSRSPGGEVDS